MSDRLRVRLAQRKDASALGSLAAELGYAATNTDAAVDGVLSREDHRLWVAEIDGHSVGYALAHVHVRLGLDGAMVSLDELVVTGSARGRGVGTALLGAVRRWAAECEAVRLELITARSLDSYRDGFYAKAGLREVDSAVLRSDIRAVEE